MKTLADDNLSDMLRARWMKRMPVNVNCVPSASDGVEISKLAQIADKILEAAAPTHIMAVEAISHPSPKSVMQKNDCDRISELDSGADVWVVPRKALKGLHTLTAVKLYGENRTPIGTFGNKALENNLGLLFQMKVRGRECRRCDPRG